MRSAQSNNAYYFNLNTDDKIYQIIFVICAKSGTCTLDFINLYLFIFFFLWDKNCQHAVDTLDMMNLYYIFNSSVGQGMLLESTYVKQGACAT